MKPGTLVDSKYRLVTRLGQGGMGAVWSAQDVQTGRPYAIKFLHPLVASENEDSRQRFLQEARTSSRVNHPGVVEFFEAGETEDGSLYLVMELLEGLNLGDAMRMDPPLDAAELLIVVGAAANAIAAAHRSGIIHRDIKPPNIFLHKEPSTGLFRAKVLDFGVSKFLAGDDGVATHTGSLLGSPRYMSPEQAVSAARADARSDIWSFGVMLFEALTGDFPHDGDSSNSLIIAIATTPPRSIHRVAPHLPVGLRMLIDDCLQPATERVQSAEALSDRVRELLTTIDLRHVPVVMPVRMKKPIARPADLQIDPSAFFGPDSRESFGSAHETYPQIAAVPVPQRSSSVFAGEEATLVRWTAGSGHVTEIEDPVSKDDPTTPKAQKPLRRTMPLAVAPVPPIFVPRVQPEDTTESVSSINVARGVTHGQAAIFTASTPPPPRGASRLMLAMLAGILVALAVLSVAIIVIKSGEAPSAKNTRAASAAEAAPASTSVAAAPTASGVDVTPVASADSVASLATTSASAPSTPATASSPASIAPRPSGAPTTPRKQPTARPVTTDPRTGFPLRL